MVFPAQALLAPSQYLTDPGGNKRIAMPLLQINTINCSIYSLEASPLGLVVV